MNEILNLIAVIIFFGVIMWLVNTFVPMPGAIKSVLNLLVLAIVVIYVLQFFDIIKTILPTLHLFK